MGLASAHESRFRRRMSRVFRSPGAIFGLASGLVFGVALQRAIADQGVDVLAIPWSQLVLFVLLAAVAGILAAVLPARRAARLDVLRAIGAE